MSCRLATRLQFAQSFLLALLMALFAGGGTALRLKVDNIDGDRKVHANHSDSHEMRRVAVKQARSVSNKSLLHYIERDESSIEEIEDREFVTTSRRNISENVVQKSWHDVMRTDTVITWLSNRTQVTSMILGATTVICCCLFAACSAAYAYFADPDAGRRRAGAGTKPKRAGSRRDVSSTMPFQKFISRTMRRARNKSSKSSRAGSKESTGSSHFAFSPKLSSDSEDGAARSRLPSDAETSWSHPSLRESPRPLGGVSLQSSVASAGSDQSKAPSIGKVTKSIGKNVKSQISARLDGARRLGKDG